MKLVGASWGFIRRPFLKKSMVIGLVAALLAFVHSNYAAVVKGESSLMLDSNTILVPLIVLLFAGLYKMAYLAAKDSKLAI